MGTEVASTGQEASARIIRIAIVDDHPMIVDGLLLLFSGMPGHQVVHTSHTGEDFLIGLRAHALVDVAIVDLQMEGMDGFAVLQRLRAERPEIRAMAFSFSDDAGWVRRAIDSGARAYVLKNTRRNELRDVIGDLLMHGFHYSERVRECLAAPQQVVAEKPIEWSLVPPREIEFAEHLLSIQDHTYDKIAEIMGVEPTTVDGYFRWFNKHYGVHSRADLVRRILLSPPPPRALTRTTDPATSAR